MLRVTSSTTINRKYIVALPMLQWLPTRPSALRHAYIAYILNTKILCTFLISLAFCTHRPSPFPLFYHPCNIAEYNVNKKVQLDATVCRHLFTAKSLYMFRVSQHPSSGALKTVTATSGIGHNKRGLIRTDQTMLE